MAVAAPHDHAVAVAQAVVAGRAVDVEALLAALDDILGDREGKLVDELAVRPFAGVEQPRRRSDVRAPRCLRSAGARSGRRRRNRLGRSGMYFGWSCMSCRQPAPARAASSQQPAHACEHLDPMLVRNFRHLPRLQSLQKLARLLAIEQRVGGFDAQEETVARCQRESRHVEHRMVRHGQPAQRQQSQHGRRSRRTEWSSRR